MEWTEVNIYTTTEGIELLCSKLGDIGIKGFSIKDAEDFKEFLENKNGQWDYIDDDLMGLSECETCITVYIPTNGQGAEMLIAIKSMLAEMKAADTEGVYGRLEAEMSNIREEDWANNWKQYFKPLPIGERLWITPTWVDEPVPAGRTALRIDPGSSFGTGQHDTTKLCLTFLEGCVQEGTHVLDIGCGSGILSIGAMLLGAKDATAIDIEQNAAESAAENAQTNGIDLANYQTICGNILEDEALVQRLGTGYDVVCANIVADILIAMRTLFVHFMKDGAKLMLSGIIDERLDEVLEAMQAEKLRVLTVEHSAGWTAVLLEK